MRFMWLIGASAVVAAAPVTFFGSGKGGSRLGATTAFADEPALTSICPADVVPDGVVDATDLVAVLDQWALQTPTPADVTADGIVDQADLIDVILALGPCPDGAGGVAAGVMHSCALEDGVTWATADGGCKDLLTGLVWSTENLGVAGAITFPFAEQLMANADEGGFTDWRFPTVAEMETVAAHGAATHFSDFSCSPNSGYWSEERQGRRNYATNVCTGETNLFQVRPVQDAIKFVAVREATATPVCGDGNCDPGEDPCNCSADCGSPSPTETDCSNGVDDDCDGLVDCDDGDCAGNPDCASACNNNGICEPGEDCENCADCEGKTNGPPSGRFCCGNGIVEGPEGDGSICNGNH